MLALLIQCFTISKTQLIWIYRENIAFTVAKQWRRRIFFSFPQMSRVRVKRLFTSCWATIACRQIYFIKETVTHVSSIIIFYLLLVLINIQFKYTNKIARTFSWLNILTAPQKLRYVKDFRIYTPEPQTEEKENRKSGKRCYTVADRRHTPSQSSMVYHLNTVLLEHQWAAITESSLLNT